MKITREKLIQAMMRYNSDCLDSPNDFGPIDDSFDCAAAQVDHLLKLMQDAGQTVHVKFEGIDNWNRPVFKDVNSNNRYGDVNNLFSYAEVEDNFERWIDFKKSLSEDPGSYLEYFGNKFGCEPMGGLNPDIILEVEF